MKEVMFQTLEILDGLRARELNSNFSLQNEKRNNTVNYNHSCNYIKKKQLKREKLSKFSFQIPFLLKRT